MLALPSLKPPGFTFLVVWQPEALQSRLPIDVVGGGAYQGDVGEGSPRWAQFG